MQSVLMFLATENDKHYIIRDANALSDYLTKYEIGQDFIDTEDVFEYVVFIRIT